jgi:uncharacterized OsmC-like protein
MSDLPPVLLVRAKAEAASHAKTINRLRSHQVISDEPVAGGGTDEGAMPLELLMASLASCSNVIGHRVAKELNIAVHHLAFDVKAKLDTKGVAMRGYTALPFPEIQLTVTLVTDAPPDRVEEMKRLLGERCAVQVVLREAGTTIVEDWRVTAPAD